jgi:hypothetical protein
MPRTARTVLEARIHVEFAFQLNLVKDLGTIGKRSMERRWSSRKCGITTESVVTWRTPEGAPLGIADRPAAEVRADRHEYPVANECRKREQGVGAKRGNRGRAGNHCLLSRYRLFARTGSEPCFLVWLSRSPLLFFFTSVRTASR